MNKSDYIDTFKDKKITVMGLGLLGRQLNVTKFLAECGADLIVTDRKDKEELESSLEELSEYDDIEYVLGRHRLSEFEGRDMIIKAASVPKDSKYIKRAREEGIPVEMDASLFAKLAPEDITLTGITGTRGKSTVTHLIKAILDKKRGLTAHIGGNVKGQATLPLLKEIASGDHVVLELDSWQLQGFGEAEISPHYSVFTNFLPDHQDYYEDMEAYFEDKSEIFRHQSQDDYLIVTEQSFKAIQKYLGEDAHEDVPGKLVLAKPQILLDGFEWQLKGEHNKQNVAMAAQHAELVGLDSSTTKEAVADFDPLSGRLSYVRKLRRRPVYNDNNATTPDATVAGIRALVRELDEDQNLTLIMGGSDKGLDTTDLKRAIKRNVENVVLLPGTGTDAIRFQLYDADELHVDEADEINEALEMALDMSSPGDYVLFSPAFASFDQFANEYEREEVFLDAVDELKR
jgi:UDP-N-acetylmuramoylalanine--D-glutamate ligase